MFCRRVKKRLVAYLDGELTDKVRVAIEKHLEICSMCRKIETELHSLNTFLNEAPKMPVPLGFSSRVLDNLRENLKEEKIRRPLVAWVPFRVMWIPAFSQATAFIIIFGIALLGFHFGTSFSSQKSVEEIFQTTEFGYMSSDSVENSYFEIIAVFNSK